MADVWIGFTSIDYERRYYVSFFISCSRLAAVQCAKFAKSGRHRTLRPLPPDGTQARRANHARDPA